MAEANGAITIESYPLRRYLLLRARGKSREYFPFIYSITVNITALATPVVGVVNIDTDAPWLWLYAQGQYNFDVTSNPIVPGVPATVLARIGGAGGRSVSRGPVAVFNMYPQRGGFHALPAAYPIEAGSQLHLTVQVDALQGLAALPWTLKFNHIGVKVYGYGGNGR